MEARGRLPLPLSPLAALAILLAGCAAPPPAHPAAAGCWLDAWSEPGYRGRLSTYTGPSYAPATLGAAKSLALGPGARLEGFDARGFADKDLDLPPGTRVPALDGLGIASFILSCD